MSVNRSTFNYGRALGAPMENLEYVAFDHYSKAFGQIATRFSNASWRLDMALKQVRDACDTDEQATALAALRVAFHAIDREFEQVENGPIKFYRYGRVGNVLKRFTPAGFKAHK